VSRTVDLDIDAETRAIDALADPRHWSAGAAVLLDGLGFVLINADHPEAPAGSHLLVALRAAPTHEHFDPEAVSFYAPASQGKVSIETLDRAAIELHGPRSRRVLWGHVHVIDRVPVENRFLCLGGELRAATIDPNLAVLDLRSPGPIVPWGGHSQGSHTLASEIGAFFGRLITAVDFQRGAEAHLAAAPPDALYAAFLSDARPRLQGVARTLGLEQDTVAWLQRETVRVREEEPAMWAAGEAILADLGG
jgi:hypothetical protein